MATPQPLLTPEVYAEYLQDPTDTRVDAVTAFIRGRCGWHIAPAFTETLTIDGSGTGLIALPSMQVTAITSVTEAGVDITGKVEWSTLGLLRHPLRWGKAFRSVVVDLTHGFAEVPADLAKVVAEAAARIPAPGGVGEKIGPFEYVGADAFLPDELETIDRYRLLPRP